MGGTSSNRQLILRGIDAILFYPVETALLSLATPFSGFFCFPALVNNVAFFIFFGEPVWVHGGEVQTSQTLAKHIWAWALSCWQLCFSSVYLFSRQALCEIFSDIFVRLPQEVQPPHRGHGTRCTSKLKSREQEWKKCWRGLRVNLVKDKLEEVKM